mmetsp:Transcript_454/g.1049  ORF Transcript_454/g.1049 Transcript_454/m.1049 type:complete len:311 (+) Transcript_454:33-965(+)
MPRMALQRGCRGSARSKLPEATFYAQRQTTIAPDRSLLASCCPLELQAVSSSCAPGLWPVECRRIVAGAVPPSLSHTAMPPSLSPHAMYLSSGLMHARHARWPAAQGTTFTTSCVPRFTSFRELSRLLVSTALDRLQIATLMICCVCRPVTSFMGLPLRRSQKRSAPSKWPDMTTCPSMDMHTALTVLWHTMVRAIWPRCKSHILTLRSLLPLTARRGSAGLHLTVLTLSVCPVSTCLTRPDAASHKRSEWSEPAPRRYLSSHVQLVSSTVPCVPSRRVRPVPLSGSQIRAHLSAPADASRMPERLNSKL